MNSEKASHWEWINAVTSIVAALLSAAAVIISVYAAQLMEQQTKAIHRQSKAQDESLLADKAIAFNEHLSFLVPKCSSLIDDQSLFAGSQSSDCKDCKGKTEPSPGAFSISYDPVELAFYTQHYVAANNIAIENGSLLSPFDYIALGIAAERVGFLEEAEKHLSKAVSKADEYSIFGDSNYDDDVAALTHLARFKHAHLKPNDSPTESDALFNKAVTLLAKRAIIDKEYRIAAIKEKWAKEKLIRGMHDDGLRLAEECITNPTNNHRDRPRLMRFYEFIAQIAQRDRMLNSLLAERRKSGLIFGRCHYPGSIQLAEYEIEPDWSILEKAEDAPAPPNEIEIDTVPIPIDQASPKHGNLQEWKPIPPRRVSPRRNK